MNIEPISAGVGKQTLMLPYVLHRVTSLLGVRSFLFKVSQRIENEMQEPDNILCSVKTSFEQLIYPSRTGPLPKPWHILEALTLRAARERLKVLGDVFLKFSTSIFLYYKSLKVMKEEYKHKDEGELTMDKSRDFHNNGSGSYSFISC